MKRRKETALKKGNGSIRTFQQFAWIAVILIQMTVVNRLEVRAEEQVLQQVEQEILYENVEGAAEIPRQVTVTVKEGDQSAVAVCDLQEAVEEGADWQEGFVLPITFHIYDADFYMLDGQMVPQNDEKPQLQGYEESLLKAARLSTEQYRIRDICWEGESYMDETGELCKNAVAVGDKLVHSYRAYYTGTAAFPVREVQTSRAASEAEETPAGLSEPETEPAGERAESVGTQVSVLSEEENTITDGGQELAGLWERITRTLLVAVGIGALLFFLGLILLAGLRMAKIVYVWYINRREKDKEDLNHVHRK